MSKKYLAVFFALFLVFSFNVSAKSKSNPHLNERFVINALRQIQTAQMTYRQDAGQGRFGAFYELYQAHLIDASLASLQKYGYSFSSNVTGPSGNSSSLYHVTAVPQRYGKTGRKSFYINENCEIRGADKNGAAANINDPIIENCTPSNLTENEILTIQSLRTIHSAEMIYLAEVGNGNFGTLDQLIAAGLIPQSLGFNFYRGYYRPFTVLYRTTGNPPRFYVQPLPELYRRTGIRSFYVDERGIIRGADKNGGFANQNDPPIEE